MKYKEENIPLKLFSLLTQVTPSGFRKFFVGFFFCLTPDIPYNLGTRIRNQKYWEPILYGCLIGFILSFVFTAAFCFSEGVLYSSQCPNCNVTFLFDDKVNLIMYIIITPLMFGLGMALFLATFKTWTNFEEAIAYKRSSLVSWKGFIIIMVIFGVATVAISNYINDVVNGTSIIGNTVHDLHYWFLGNPNKLDRISPLTIYYTLLNFLILIFIFCCIATFITAVRPIVNLANKISSELWSSENEEIQLLERLSSFADVYLFAKMLLALTMIHSFVWSYSPLAVTENFNIERSFIVIVSLFFMALPRLHFENEWHRAALKCKEQGISIDLKPIYIRGFHYYAIWVADYLVIGGYLVSLTGLVDWGEYSGK